MDHLRSPASGKNDFQIQVFEFLEHCTLFHLLFYSGWHLDLLLDVFWGRCYGIYGLLRLVSNLMKMVTLHLMIFVS